mmetsp:Transcript_4551/g.20658  ORF Transcript_4551/g.20658 Transcript_4551/m.20658 type:complete len:384 (+) Transcript_4551:2189-3340(+)
MSSRGRDLYPSLHTRHTSAPVVSSSSSSEMSSMPSMLLGDVADASKSRAPGVPRSGDPVGVSKPEPPGGVVANPSEPTGETDEWVGGFPNDGDAGDRRVRPISRSIFSRRSIAFCAFVALVARRSSAMASAALGSTSSTHSSAFSASVPTPRSVTGSRACSRRSSVGAAAEVASGVASGVASRVASGVASGTHLKVDVAAAAAAAPSGCDRMSPPSVASAWGSAARAHASLHPMLPLSRSLAPGAENATSSRYPVTARSAPIAIAFDFSLAPATSRGIPSTTNAQHLSSSASVSAPGNPTARLSRSLSPPQVVATCAASACAASTSPAASRGRTLASVAAAAPSLFPPLVSPWPPAPLVSSASLTRKTCTCFATSASAEATVG